MPQLRRHLSKVFYICDGAPAKIYENRFWADFLLLFMGYLLGEKLAPDRRKLSENTPCQTVFYSQLQAKNNYSTLPLQR